MMKREPSPQPRANSEVPQDDFKWTTMTIEKYPEEDPGDPEVWLRTFAIKYPRKMGELVTEAVKNIENIEGAAADFWNGSEAANGRR